MSNALLDYSSWSFQVIFVLIVLYLVAGLVKPAWVGAGSRRTIRLGGRDADCLDGLLRGRAPA
jgi:hypothetical protein